MFTLELEELKTKAIDKLRELIAEHGVQSKYVNKMCFDLFTDEVINNLSTSQFIEITQHELISELGHHYTFNRLPIEDLFEIVDFYNELFGNDK